MWCEVAQHPDQRQSRREMNNLHITIDKIPIIQDNYHSTILVAIAHSIQSQKPSDFHQHQEEGFQATTRK